MQLRSVAKVDGPKLVSLSPPAAMPGGEVELLGSDLQGKQSVFGPEGNGGRSVASTAVLPRVTVGDTPVALAMSRPGRMVVRIPEGTISGDVVAVFGEGLLHEVASNPLNLRVAVPMAENLHPVANPGKPTPHRKKDEPRTATQAS